MMIEAPLSLSAAPAGATQRVRRDAVIKAALAAGMVVAAAAANFLLRYHIGAWLTLGAFPYALTFVFNELANRLYGARAARRVVWWGALASVPASALVAPARITAASGCAFVLAQLLDVTVFARLRRRRRWWLAPAAASVLAAGLDTTAFFTLAFAGTGASVGRLICGDFAVKVALDACMLAPFRWLAGRLAAPPAGLGAPGAAATVAANAAPAPPGGASTPRPAARISGAAV